MAWIRGEVDRETGKLLRSSEAQASPACWTWKHCASRRTECILRSQLSGAVAVRSGSQTEPFWAWKDWGPLWRWLSLSSGVQLPGSSGSVTWAFLGPCHYHPPPLPSWPSFWSSDALLISKAKAGFLREGKNAHSTRRNHISVWNQQFAIHIYSTYVSALYG